MPDTEDSHFQPGAEAGEHAQPAQPAGPTPCPVLSAVYGSERPAVDLLPGVGLAPVVLSCAPMHDVQAMLQETWLRTGSAEEDSSQPAPSFNPSSMEYDALPRRIGRSSAMHSWHDLKVRTKQAEANLDAMPAGPDKEAKAAEVEELKGQLAAAEAQIQEVKAAIEQDTLALVPWMQALFALADAGMTTFDVSGPAYPYTSLYGLFGQPHTGAMFDLVERLLGTFKRRYEAERGPGKIQILTRFVPNMFHDEFAPATTVAAAVERSHDNVLGADSSEPLDLVQVYWYDFEGHDPVPTLRALQRLAEDQPPEQEGGEPGLRRRIKGIGLIDFGPEAIKAALKAGVSVTCVQVAFSVLDSTTAYDTLELCRQHGIKVLARNGLMDGLVSDKYLGAPCPDTLQPDADLDNLLRAADTIKRCGGWTRFQALLAAFQQVADRHGVKLQTVALRWQMDQGTFPMATIRWPPNPWSLFGHSAWADAGRPGVDAALFQKASFLTEADALQIASAVRT